MIVSQESFAQSSQNRVRLNFVPNITLSIINGLKLRTFFNKILTKTCNHFLAEKIAEEFPFFNKYLIKTPQKGHFF
jgi:hypothetical protein